MLSLKERACAAFGLDPSKVEIWDYFNHGKYANLEKDSHKDLEAARILDEQPILLDDLVSEGGPGGGRGGGGFGGVHVSTLGGLGYVLGGGGEGMNVHVSLCVGGGRG